MKAYSRKDFKKALECVVYESIPVEKVHDGRALFEELTDVCYKLFTDPSYKERLRDMLVPYIVGTVVFENEEFPCDRVPLQFINPNFD